MTNFSKNNFLTPQDLADRWGIHATTLANWRMTGRGPRFIKIGSRVRYNLEEIQAFEMQQTHRNTGKIITQ